MSLSIYKTKQESGVAATAGDHPLNVWPARETVGAVISAPYTMLRLQPPSPPAASNVTR